MLPETVCPSSVPNDLHNWVVKPALGRVGENIAISGVTSEQKLRRIHKAAKRNPSHWVAQRRFTVLPPREAEANYHPSIGVFTVDGCVAGAYARIGRKPLIDDEAQDIAVLIAGEGNV
jgi:glutathionylspermidine synthase